MSDATDIREARIEKDVGLLASKGDLSEPDGTNQANGRLDQAARTIARLRYAKTARPLLNVSSRGSEGTIAYRCPVCGNPLPHFAALPPFDAPCCECHSYLWCRQQDSANGVILEAISGRAPERWEVRRVVDSLGRQGPPDRVTIDMSKLTVINCSFLAALVEMRKRLRSFGCTLRLCELRPAVREIFDHLRLNRLFGIEDGEQPSSSSQLDGPAKE